MLPSFVRKKITALPEAVASRIAAGEVVERPVSIVKEVIENSIDSGADLIILEIKNGGKSYIRVTDDGDMYVSNPFYCWYRFNEHENNEIELIYFTESNGKDTATKEIVGTFNKNGNNKQAVYYIPEKYIQKYDMLESKLIENFPTKGELKDIMTEDNLVWKRK